MTLEAALFNSFAGSLHSSSSSEAPIPPMAGVLNWEEDRSNRAAMKVLPPSPPQQEDSSYRRLSGPALSQVQEECASSECLQPAQPPVQPGDEDVRKRGYLRKQKHGHKRYFVLRTHSHLGPARLEYYDNEKKFRSGQRPGCPPKRVILLSQCFTVSRRADAKNKHLLALYTKDEYFAMVAESEPEQDSWYQALSDLITENKKSCLDTEELEDNCGGLRGGSLFKEVWQVNVKPRGLGQSKNLSGVYRLCLSSKAVHLVKLSSDVACVHLLLMNIRRCGHSENYFFIEVGRSSSTGAGELWMQVDDCVVAQNMHETFLETMKALKAYSEFRPRSKSQSSGTNPISFITTRRYLGNLPPSQTGLQRRSRTESVAGTPPTTTKNSAYRFRTSSEGEGTMTRPFRSVTGSLIHLNTARINLGKQEGTGRYVRAPFNSGYHSRSASLPVSHFPSATSPISVCSSSGLGSASETLTRPSSSSVCGSPSDGGFISSDEYGSSPGDLRYFRVRSNTPDSLGNTPPIQEENTLSDYMSMSTRNQPNGRDDYMEADKCFRKRTYSLTKPTSSTLQQHKSHAAASLDEDDINKQFAYSESPKLTDSNHPEDYSNGLINSVCNQSGSKAKDDGYMPMMPSVSYDSDYLPMAPKSASAPKQIVSMCPSQVDSKGYMMMFPTASSPVRNFTSGSLSKGNQEKVTNGEYMDMSCRNSSTVKQTNDSNLSNSRGFSSYFSLPRSFKSSSKPCSDHNEYVPMSSPGKLLHLGLENATDGDGESKIDLKSSASILDQQVRATRPTKLTLSMRGSNTIPRMFDHSNSTEPTSPGEYINIDFSDKASSTPYSLSAEGSPSSLGSSCDHRQSPLSDYMSVDIDVQSPKASAELSNSLTDISSYSCPGISRIQPSADYAKLPCGTACVSATNMNEDYTTMTFNMAMTPPRPFPSEAENGTQLGSPSSIVDRLRIGDVTSFNSGFPSVLHPVSEPVVGPKVIRADAQGRRRHSSETFSSASTVTTTTTSSCFTESGKRHSSASFDNVWLKPDEGTCDQEKTMSKHCSTGFQHGLNYIALSMHDGVCEASSPACSQHQNGSRNLESGAYVSIDFTRSDCLKCPAFRKD
ncbi:insulin receptor substrate 4 isoform X2 [Bufo bufo]|uniref:insulin receptor substrate 4 isoform X1 n=1 Tax=Bufo bufo TaxID=8384 RepID=UPI001ABDA339|nr:insulin receptor substrate 4 isoform X1 [Bufo bufo]XP_040298272.1 insulin receptor substrate 4 isoform X2 [Bufo bufo]